MTSALRPLVDMIPFMDSAQQPEPPRVEQPVQGAEIAYTDVDAEGRPTTQVLKFKTPEAYNDAEAAARILGYTALANNMQDRKARGFEPVESDEFRGDETAREEWSKGSYDPNVFHGQTALALRWLLEQAAENPTRPTLGNGGHMLPSGLWSRMVLHNEKTTPVNNIKAQVDPEVVKLAEEIQAQGPDASAVITNDGSLTKPRETGGLDYDAMRETDPKLQKVQ